jgi:hypothetical protein
MCPNDSRSKCIWLGEQKKPLFVRIAKQTIISPTEYELVFADDGDADVIVLGTHMTVPPGTVSSFVANKEGSIWGIGTKHTDEIISVSTFAETVDIDTTSIRH